MKVEPSHVRYFRFCNYTGKYFCQNCHSNALSMIPAYVIERWSFKRSVEPHCTCACMYMYVQWNPSIVDTLRTSCIERCPHFRGQLLLRKVFGTKEAVLTTEVSFKRGSTVMCVTETLQQQTRHSKITASLIGLIEVTTSFQKRTSKHACN